MYQPLKDSVAENPTAFEQRKQDHIELALQDKNQAPSKDLDKMHLIHCALPDLDFSELDISTSSLGKTFTSPFFISSMTAGHPKGKNINRILAEAAASQGWVMGVGSQRKELFSKTASEEWRELRQHIAKVSLYGNIGIAQVIQTPSADIQRLCDALEADALFIHCNPLQECIQPEGTPQFRGALPAIARLCTELSVPIIVKETGCGFSEATLSQLMGMGVAAVDVSGLGGTHWGRIEGGRSEQLRNRQTAEAFKQWGISTFQSLLNSWAIRPDYELWASGGVRSGLDAAKYLALGAKRVGIAKPMLAAAMDSVDAVIELMQSFEYQLKTALFCTGSQNIAALRGQDKWQIET